MPDLRMRKLKKKSLTVISVCFFSFLFRFVLFAYKPFKCVTSQTKRWSDGDLLTPPQEDFEHVNGKVLACLRYFDTSTVAANILRHIFPWGFYPLPELLCAVAFLVYVNPTKARQRKIQGKSAYGTDLHDACLRGDSVLVEEFWSWLPPMVGLTDGFGNGRHV